MACGYGRDGVPRPLLCDGEAVGFKPDTGSDAYPGRTRDTFHCYAATVSAAGTRFT
jgi:hypothetical protein